jgi:hypothetical protein
MMLKRYAREIAARAIWIYAHWEDGVQYVGTTGTTLKKAQEEIMSGKWDGSLGLDDYNLPETTTEENDE